MAGTFRLKCYLAARPPKQNYTLKPTIAALFLLATGFAWAQATPEGEKMTSAVTPDLVKEFAPTGKLRFAINTGNPVLVQKDAKSGALSGVTLDLAQELGRRLGVPVALTEVDAAGKSFEALKAGNVDVVFLAIEPVRAAEVEFTAPYVIIEGTYLVPKDSNLQAIADVDREGIRIAVNRNSAYDLFLTRTLKHAKLFRSEDGVAQFVADKLEAAAGVKQPLVGYARKHPEVRVMEGRFMEIRQAMGLPKGRAAASAYLKAFVEEMKATGFVADSLKRSNQPDAAVAPPG
jgi:polar amino acid transport system substrate-binding protein